MSLGDKEEKLRGNSLFTCGFLMMKKDQKVVCVLTFLAQMTKDSLCGGGGTVVATVCGSYGIYGLT